MLPQIEMFRGCAGLDPARRAKRTTHLPGQADLFRSRAESDPAARVAAAEAETARDQIDLVAYLATVQRPR